MACSYKAPPKEDTYALIKKAASGDMQAKELLIELNTGLVKSIAIKFINRGYELDDLVQIGFIGLLKAIDKFDTSFDVMFSTYAVPMIMGEIKRHIRDDGKIKMSRQLKQEIGIVKRAGEEYYNQNGRYPKLSELAEITELSLERVLEIMEAAEAIIPESLDNAEKPVPETGFVGNNYVEEEDKRLNAIYLKGKIGELPERERTVIVLRYFHDMTQQQIASRMGISQVQVSRIEKKVIEKFRMEIGESLI